VSERSPKNLPASIRQKLSDLARARTDDFGLILVKYGLERILYRLTRSTHPDAFVLKGALLFELRTHDTYRPIRDADFLGRSDNAPERLADPVNPIPSSRCPSREAAIASEWPAIRPESADSLRAETSQIGQVIVNRLTEARLLLLIR